MKREYISHSELYDKLESILLESDSEQLEEIANKILPKNICVNYLEETSFEIITM